MPSKQNHLNLACLSVFVHDLWDFMDASYLGCTHALAMQCWHHQASMGQ